MVSAGIAVTLENKRRMDQAIHNLVEVKYKDYPVTWKRLKQDFLVDEKRQKQFVANLKKAIMGL